MSKVGNYGFIILTFHCNCDDMQMNAFAIFDNF